jgi:6-phosphogluconolactonase/glucosamine-6-phosphate isomerase/deaminase
LFGAAINKKPARSTCRFFFVDGRLVLAKKAQIVFRFATRAIANRLSKSSKYNPRLKAELAEGKLSLDSA